MDPSYLKGWDVITVCIWSSVQICQLLIWSSNFSDVARFTSSPCSTFSGVVPSCWNFICICYTVCLVYVAYHCIWSAWNKSHIQSIMIRSHIRSIMSRSHIRSIMIKSHIWSAWNKSHIRSIMIRSHIRPIMIRSDSQLTTWTPWCSNCSQSNYGSPALKGVVWHIKASFIYKTGIPP